MCQVVAVVRDHQELPVGGDAQAERAQPNNCRGASVGERLAIAGGAILQQWPGHHVRAEIAGRPLWEDGTRVAMDNCW
jgi:hypothetical protein